MERKSKLTTWMRYLLAIALLMASFVVIAKPVKADSKNETFYIASESGTLSNTLYNGNTWTIKLTNNTSYSATLPFKFYWSMRNGNGGYSKETLRVIVDGNYYYPTVQESVYSNSAYSYNVSIAAGATKTVTIYYSNSANANAKSTQYMNMTVDLKATINASYTNGGSSTDPTKLNLDTNYTLPKTSNGYYYFTLDKTSTVTVKTKSANAYSYNISTSSTGGQTSGSISESSYYTTRTFKLAKGEYYFLARNTGSLMDVSISKTDFTWGTMNITVSGDNVSATYTDAATADSESISKTYITGWSCDSNSRESTSLTGKSKSFLQQFNYDIDNPGYYTIKVTVKNEAYGDAYMTYSKEFVKKPTTPSGFAIAKAGQTGASTNYLGVSQNGNYIAVQLFKGGKWQTVKIVKTYSSATVGGLTPNTVYKMRIAGVVRKSGKPDVYSSYSKEVSFRTGAKQKPIVKSVKISGAKVKYIPKVYHPGHWNGNYTYYYKGYYTGGYYTTSYKITVVLKTRISGPSGMMINAKYVKGTGKKFVLNTYSTGKKKGKKIKVNIAYANSASYGGTSSYTTKSVKVK